MGWFSNTVHECLAGERDDSMVRSENFGSLPIIFSPGYPLFSCQPPHFLDKHTLQAHFKFPSNNPAKCSVKSPRAYAPPHSRFAPKSDAPSPSISHPPNLVRQTGSLLSASHQTLPRTTPQTSKILATSPGSLLIAPSIPT
jgi:hypothetical protein